MYYVYILSNWCDSVLYIGVTNNLLRRLYEHRNHLVEGFAEKYQTNKLVYFEATGDVRVALEREKQLKGWNRAKKNALISINNPQWKDLSADWDF
ncbi:MAG: GIY-YIG nuclease family protein [Oscillospiraceae bacterium]|nr:GIY-YIG nuclease family protein [Oscillospiraceae bacterium]